jgi:hypothetical protein
MSEIRSIGLTYIKLGDIAEDGGMGTSLTALGVTYRDSADFIQDDPEINNIFSEENDDPEETIETEGVKRVKWSIMNYDPDTLIRVLGGTSTGVAPNKIWSAPAAKDPIELSIEILTKKNIKIQIPRAHIAAKINWAFRRNGVALVDIIATVLTPTKSGTAKVTVQNVEDLPES